MPLASLSDLGTLRDSSKVHQIRAYNNEPHRASLRLISRSLHMRDLDGLSRGGVRVNIRRFLENAGGVGSGS